MLQNRFDYRLKSIFTFLSVFIVSHLVLFYHKFVVFQDVSERVELPGCYILGAGAGSKHVVGVNCEMMPNLRCDGEYQLPISGSLVRAWLWLSG